MKFPFALAFTPPVLMWIGPVAWHDRSFAALARLEFWNFGTRRKERAKEDGSLSSHLHFAATASANASAVCVQASFVWEPTGTPDEALHTDTNPSLFFGHACHSSILSSLSSLSVLVLGRFIS